MANENEPGPEYHQMMSDLYREHGIRTKTFGDIVAFTDIMDPSKVLAIGTLARWQELQNGEFEICVSVGGEERLFVFNNNDESRWTWRSMPENPAINNYIAGVDWIAWVDADEFFSS